MAEQTVRYCTSADGTRIAYAVKAGERPALIFVAGWPSSIAMVAELYGRRLAEEVAFGHEFIYYDRRGTGSSDRKVDDISLPRQVEDVAALIDDYGEDVNIYGVWDGTPICIAYAATNPERVRRMVLGGAYARGSDIISQEALQSTVNMARTNWAFTRRSLAAIGGASRDEMPTYLETLRRSHSGEIAALYLEQYGTMDAAEYLDQVTTPTLVTHRPSDGAVPQAASEFVASRIPNCRFQTVADGRAGRTAALSFLWESDGVSALVTEDVSEPAQIESVPDRSEPLTASQSQDSTGRREVQYCTTDDGVQIAYSVVGQGPPLLVCPFMMESFSLHGLVPEIESFYRVVGGGRTLIYYDVRGSGMSQRNVDDLSLDASLLDMKAVIEASGLDRVSIWSPGMGGPRATKYAALHPDRVNSLVLYSTFARLTDALPAGTLEAFEALARSNWEVFCQTAADWGAARSENGDAPMRLAQMDIRSTDGETVARLIHQNADLDVTPLLSKVLTRTLVIHRLQDSVRPVALGQALASRIPGARLVTPPGAVAGYMWGDVAAITDAINGFLDEDPETRALATARRVPTHATDPPSATAIILFADIVDSTGMTERLGDRGFRDRARELDGMLREIIRGMSGTPIEGKLLGDGVLATFVSASRAIEAAQACAVKGDEVGLRLHLGLHAGDVIMEDNNVFGGAVNMAARISALSEPGSLLVSDIVRGLARTSAGVSFEDRGEHTLKGIAEPVRVYEVRWQE